MSAIGSLLSRPVDAVPCESVAQWWPQHLEIAAAAGDHFSRAVLGGFASDRVGWAFASGYQAALRALFTDAPGERICALCVTEADGNSPKAIKSTLRREGAAWLLNGAKRWTTLGPDGALFYVAARDLTAPGDRPAIRLARISSGARGLTVQNMPPTNFVPEVPHAQLQFENLELTQGDLLPGDGYTSYVKPFRTVEDIYVNAAVLAYLVREARRLAWPREWTERCVSLLHSLQALAEENPSAPATHVALAGALGCAAELLGLADGNWNRAPKDSATARWQRDRALFGIAAKARSARTERAWQNLS
jgi:acyl-CoA dehydrogenase